jgi:flagellar hook-basal body complex protein FliE
MPIEQVAGPARLDESSPIDISPADAVVDKLAPLEGGPAAPAFADVIGKLVQQVDTAQTKSDQMVQSLALGDPVDIHQVMLSVNEANTSMQLLLQLRSKVLDAYQEIMRTQV